MHEIIGIGILFVLPFILHKTMMTGPGFGVVPFQECKVLYSLAVSEEYIRGNKNKPQVLNNITKTLPGY